MTGLVIPLSHYGLCKLRPSLDGPLQLLPFHLAVDDLCPPDSSLFSLTFLRLPTCRHFQVLQNGERTPSSTHSASYRTKRKGFHHTLLPVSLTAPSGGPPSSATSSPRRELGMGPGAVSEGEGGPSNSASLSHPRDEHQRSF